MKALVAVTRPLGWFLLVGVLWLPTSVSAQSSQRPLEPDHWSYDLLDLLQALGHPGAWAGWVEPLPAAAVLQALLGSEGELGAQEGAAGAAWAGSLAGELGRRGDGGAPGLLLGAVGGYERGAADILPPRGAFGGVSLEARLTDGFTLWGSVSADEYTGKVVFREGGGALRWRGMQLVGGRFPVALGQGTSRILANGRQTMDGVLFGTRRPGILPGVLRYLGPTSLQIFAAPSVENADGFQSWFGTMGLSISPHPRIQIGMNRSARFAGEGVADWDWDDFWDMIIGNSEFNDFDDSQGELDLRLRAPLFGLEVTGYATVGFEDKGSIKEDPALVAGVLIPFSRGGSLFSARYEYSAHGEAAMLCGSCDFRSHRWYKHHRYGLYALEGAFMGTELGGYGLAHAVEFEFWSGWSDRMPVRARTRLFYQEREDQNRLEEKWPGIRRGMDLEVAIRPASAWEIRGNLVYSRVSGKTESRALLGISIFDVLGFPGF